MKMKNDGENTRKREILTPYEGNQCHKDYEKMISVKFYDECNGSCSFCVDRGGYKTDSYIDVDKMIEETIKLNEFQKVIVTGGEPLLKFDELITYLKAIRSHKEHIVLNTNGSLLSHKKVCELNGLIDELQISIHHFNEEKHSKIVGIPISFKNIEHSLSFAEFNISINSAFTNAYSDDEIDAAIYNLAKLSRIFRAYKLRLTELKKVSDEDFVEADKFFNNEYMKLKFRDNLELYTGGCVERFLYTHYDLDKIKSDTVAIGLEIKKLCPFSKGIDNFSFNDEANKNCKYQLDTGTSDTFRVIYPDGTVMNDWYYNPKFIY